MRGQIDGVMVRDLDVHTDERGWLTECWRLDQLPHAVAGRLPLKGETLQPEEEIPLGELGSLDVPAMTYVSLTQPGVTRGPHEHREQTDWFVFPGPGIFIVTLRDARQKSKTFMAEFCCVAGQGCPRSIVVPPGVVHGYKCISDMPGIVINSPNKLYRGWGGMGEVDEIRHEEEIR